MATAPAHAVLIDNRTFTTDTGTGLAWLDLTESTGFSFAAASDLDTFFTNAGFPGLFHGSDHSAPFPTLLNLLGITLTGIGKIQSQGHFDNG